MWYEWVFYAANYSEDGRPNGRKVKQKRVENMNNTRRRKEAQQSASKKKRKRTLQMGCSKEEFFYTVNENIY